MEALAYGYIISTIFNFISVNEIILFALKIFGINYYHLTDEEAKQAVNIINPWASGTNITDNFPNGIFISKKGIGYACINIHNNFNVVKKSHSIKILTFLKPDEFKIRRIETNLSLGSMGGTITKSFINYKSTMSQQNIVDMIIQYYDKHGYARCFLYGQSGAGKTTVAALLACNMNGVLYLSFDIIKHIPNLQFIYNRHFPHPTIILIDEVDVIIDYFDDNEKDIDKKIWNAFLDNIKSYFHCIIIMTSNKKPRDITDDLSIIETHRIDILEEMF